MAKMEVEGEGNEKNKLDWKIYTSEEM